MSDKPLLTPRQQEIIRFARSSDWFSASEVNGILPEVSSATLRRDLTDLVERTILERIGKNKGVKYALTEESKLFVPYAMGEYYQQDDDKRDSQTDYNFATFPALSATALFSSEQTNRLREATHTFYANARGAGSTIYQKELERFVIEFSWKSSKIEGNTYSLLDAESLLQWGIEADGKSKYETKMILNHKQAYLFAVESAHANVPIDAAYIEHVHSLVSEGLGIERGVRSRMVGITGSQYRPLAIRQQLREQLGVLAKIIVAKKDPHEQALIAVLGLSYLQPFEDGNKRTARVLANALLLQAGYAPLSYRSVDEREYKEATLIFYEQNSIVPFRELFIEQYVYSATHYNIAGSNPQCL